MTASHLFSRLMTGLLAVVDSAQANEVVRLVDHIVVLDSGRVVTVGPLKDTLARLTRRSAVGLGLLPDLPVWVQIKAVTLIG